MSTTIKQQAINAHEEITRGYSAKVAVQEYKQNEDVRKYQDLPKEERIRIITDDIDAKLELFKYSGPTDIENEKERENKINNYRSLIIDGNLYLSSRDQFNDPFDVYPIYTSEPQILSWRELAERSIETCGEKLNHRDQEKEIRKIIINNEELKRNIIEKLRSISSNFGIFCLTESGTNLLMWSHYGKDHTGICLVFDTSESYHLSFLTHKAEYNDDNNRPKINITAKFDDDTFNKTLLVKSKDWKYEEEWRLTIPDMARNTIKIPPTAITGVIFGAKATKKQK